MGSPEIELNREIQKYGFVAIDNFAHPDEIDEVERALSIVMPTPSAESTHVDFNKPSSLSKSLLSTSIYSKCKKFAENYFGKKCHYLYDHAIYKYGFCEAPTYWHQDQVYLGPEVIINSLNFWIPLQSVDRLNGGIRFSKNSPKILLPHRRISALGTDQLAADIPEQEDSVTVSLEKGGVTVHTNWTLHSAGANYSSLTRKAWILHFSPTSLLAKRFKQIGSKLFCRFSGSKEIDNA